MSLNFNVDPYYDDFDQTKNFHRILFKPGAAVQARELTQSQTILQDQITKFADNIFKQNSPVTGGQVTTNFNCNYIKLQSTYQNAAIDVTQWNGKLITDSTGTVLARVIAVATATGTSSAGDPPTLIVSYKSGVQFTDNAVIYDTGSNLTAQAIISGATGSSSVASISQGVFYILGNFVQIQPSTTIISKYSNTPTARVGLTITETVFDYIDDASLLDPAIGASNYQAPGADRYVIALTLDTRPVQLGDDQNFVELVRVTNGLVQKLVDGSVYNVIDDYFAKRDYETNGDYVVNDFKLTPKTNTADSSNATYIMSVGKGLAYVHGYRTEVAVPIDLVTDRARTTASQNNNPVSINYGNYFYVDTLRGANASFFDTTTTQSLDIHCVPTANINTYNAATYGATVVASGYIRGFAYDHNTTDANTASYVYRAYVNSLQNAMPTANAVAATANTITFPGTYSGANNAYVGVNISITSGTDAGDFKTITAYNGVTKVATLNSNWITTPDTTSVFALNFDIKDGETLVAANSTYGILSSANINTESRVGQLSTGGAVLQNPNAPELLFNVGAPFVSTLTNTAYTTQQLFRGIQFTGATTVSAQLNYEGALVNVFRHFGTPGTNIPASLVKQNYTIVVTNPQTNANLNVGDVVCWTTTGRTIGLDNDASIATLSATDLHPFTADILATVYAETADNTGYLLKYKNYITANTNTVNMSGTQVNTYTFVDDTSLTSTGQVYIQNAGLVTPGSKQSLYLSDVKNIVKIIDTGASGTTPTVAMLSNPAYDVTNNFIFDNGQRDSHYDHATIALKPGAPKPKGNLLVLVNYYQHAGGDGYFSIVSYLSSSKPDSYINIGTYTAKTGTTYQLRDVIDFRPARRNAQTYFVYRYSGASNVGVNLPVDQTQFTGNYSYYLGRKDKLVLSKDKSFSIVEGAPSLTPLAPSEPDGSLVLANLIHRPYTGYLPTEAPAGTLPDLSIEKVQHKRYTMEDIAGLETRINQIEYYTSLSLLEQKASSLQISDAYGLNRFKNGIMVDDFSSFSTADTNNTDYAATINRRDGIMTATQNVKNFPFKSFALVPNGNLANTALNSLNYAVSGDGIVNYYTLPYTTANVATQKFASRTVNLNPFSFVTRQGTLYITPNVDNWVDTYYAPSLLVVDPSLQVFQAGSTINTMTYGDWKTIPGTTSSTTTNLGTNSSGTVGYTQVNTYGSQTQTNVLGLYNNITNIKNTYSLNNGYITDISILPYIRPQQIVVAASGMLFNTPVDAYFDNINVDGFVRKTNVIELSGVTGTFKFGDTIGYYSAGKFTPTAQVIGTYVYPSGNVRLYVAADPYSTTYNNGLTLQNGFYNTSGAYVNSTASGTVSSTKHFGGRVQSANTTTMKIQLSPLASTTDGYYTGNTINFCAGSAAGQSSTISVYYGANQTAVLATTIPVANSDIYSIGTFSTDENGGFFGIYNLPANTFHTGQRVLRIDNSNGNIGTETTSATATYYAEGLQTVSQMLDFGASPAGAKNTFEGTQNRSGLITSTITSYAIPPQQNYDPVAQTFMIDSATYPNGIFLNSASFFFATKPTDNSTVKLSIVGTINGYPAGDSLDHSIVELHPSQVNTSSTPQYLDSTTSTVFQFTAPVYIRPDVLYSFILKSNSQDYSLWTASNGDTALPSSTKNLPTDPVPSTITKIAGAPYIGALFVSQNSQTWTADQNQSMMFVLDRCVFTNTNPTIQYVIPNKLPQRTLIDQSIQYYLNANNVSSTLDAISYSDILVDAFNITTTDLVPTTTDISYQYNATLAAGGSAGTIGINPGKYGTPTQDDIYLSDGQGERILQANSNTSLALYATLSTGDTAVSPMISDAGLTAYAIKWNINNCELSNSLITLANSGSGYNVACTTVTVSAPTGLNGTQAYASANISGGVVQSVYITSPGSGYITTPTITIADANSTPGTGATVVVAGETSKSGGNAATRYVTKKVVLDQGFDSGDLNVYMTAYRPVNTDINVYYKILNRNDTQKFEDSSWQLMTKINNSGSSFSSTRGDLIEYSFAPGTNGVDQGFVTYTSTNGQTYTTFSQFAIKVVFTTTDHTIVPFATDLRAIALPSNVNTTV